MKPLSGIAARVVMHLERLQGTGPSRMLARGGVGGFAVAGASAGLAVLLQLLVSRVLGAEQFGQYAYAVTWGNFLAVFASIGYDTAALRFVPAYRATANWGLLRGFLRHSLIVSAVCGIALALGGGLVAYLGTGVGAMVLTVGAAVRLPFLVMLRMLACHLQGFGRAVLALSLQGLFRPVVMGVAILLIGLSAAHELNAALVMALNLCATLLACALAGGAVRQMTSRIPAGPASAHARPIWTRTALLLLLITAAEVVVLSTDTLMLGLMRGTLEAGLYSVAAQLSTAITLAITGVNGVLPPLIAELHVGNRRVELQRILTMAARAVLAYAAPVAIVLAVFGGPLLGLFGAEFRAAGTPLAILAGGHLTVAACGAVGPLMTMTGHEREASLIIAAWSLANVIMNAILIPPFGMIGAALATTATMIGRSVILSVIAFKRSGLRCSAFG